MPAKNLQFLGKSLRELQWTGPAAHGLRLALYLHPRERETAAYPAARVAAP
jgi:hypothetical protein